MPVLVPPTVLQDLSLTRISLGREEALEAEAEVRDATGVEPSGPRERELGALVDELA